MIVKNIQQLGAPVRAFGLSSLPGGTSGYRDRGTQGEQLLHGLA